MKKITLTRSLCYSFLITFFCLPSLKAEQWCGDDIIAKNKCHGSDESWVVQMNLFSDDPNIKWGSNDCVSFEGCVTSAEWNWSNPGAWSQLLLEKEGFCGVNNRISNTADFNVSYSGSFSGAYSNHRLAIVSWGKTADNCDWTTDNLYELYIHEQSFNEGTHDTAYDWCLYKGTSPTCSGSTYELYDCEYQILGRSIRCWRNNPRTSGTTDVDCLWEAWRDLGIAPDVYYYFTEVGSEVGPNSGGTFNISNAEMIRVANGDAIANVTAPTAVSPGEQVTVPVQYNATTNRDIQVVLQLNSDPYTNYGGNFVSVSSGSGTVNITFTVDESTPIANDSYHLQTFITTDGDSWEQRLDNLLVNNIDCIQATFSDDIITTTTPSSVTQGEEVTINVSYEASANRDLVVVFQKDSDPWTQYGSKTVDVSAGSGSVDVAVTINTNTPTGTDEYQFQTFLTTDGGGWNERFDNLNKNNVDVVSAGSSANAYYIKNKATGRYLRPASTADDAKIQVATNDNSNWFKWEKVATSSGYYYLKNVQTGKYFRPANDDDGTSGGTDPNGDGKGALIVQKPTNFSGNWTQWKDEPSGDGEYVFLINRALNKHMRPNSGNPTSDIELRPNTWKGSWPRWAFEEVGNGSRQSDHVERTKTMLSTHISHDYSNLHIRGGQFKSASLYGLNGELKWQSGKPSDEYNIQLNSLKTGIYIVKTLDIFGEFSAQKVLLK